MAEWSIATVLKTVEGHTSGGSNPSLSAINIDNQAVVKFTHKFAHTFRLVTSFLSKIRHVLNLMFRICLFFLRNFFFSLCWILIRISIMFRRCSKEYDSGT